MFEIIVKEDYQARTPSPTICIFATKIESSGK